MKKSFWVSFRHDFNYLCLLAILFSFVGFIGENIYNITSKGVINDCGYIFPFCAAYGLISFLMYIIGRPDEPEFFGIKIFKAVNLKTKIISNSIYILLLAGLILAGNIAVGYFWHYVFGVELWDFSDWTFPVTKYAALVPTLIMTTGMYLILRFIYFPLLNMLREHKSPQETIGAAIFYILLFMDMLWMIIQYAFWGDIPTHWELNLRDNSIDWFFLIDVILIVLIFVALIIFLLANAKYFTVKKYVISKKDKKAKFAIFIAARNESAVIESTLEAIVESDYPILKRDIYVMVQEPDDPTIEICKKFRHVYCNVRTTTDQGKGYVLDEIVKLILKKNRQYDAYLILDADNIVDAEYLSRMNDAFVEGFDIVVGNRNNKNWNSSATSGASGLTFSIINFQNELKTRFKEMVLLTGTGFCIKSEIINSLGGWPFHSLTEDYEISRYAAENNLTSCYVSDAIFYDEQPIHLRDSIKQRTRWVKGFMDNQNKGKKMNLAGISGFAGAILFIGFVIYNIVLAFIGLFKNDINVYFIFVLAALAAYYIIVVLISFFIFFKDRKNNNITVYKAIRASLFHPIFLATYIVSFFRIFKKKGKTWETIPHSVQEVEETK